MPRIRRLRTYRHPPLGRYLLRLITLCMVTAAALVMLSRQTQHWFDNGMRDAVPANSDPVGTALTASPFNLQGAGVFQADGGAGPSEASADGPIAADLPAVDPVDIDSQLLEGVLDKTTSIRPRAYYHLVTLAEQATPEALKHRAHSEKEITLAHLATEPDEHRGELIYLEGQLRGLVRFDATDNKVLNPSGLRTLYQGDLFTSAAHPYPYVIVTPSVPEGLPLGMDLSEKVTFAGFFLQLWRYKSAGGVDRVAPLLIGRMVKWTPAQKVNPTSNLGNQLVWALVLLVVGLVAVIWALNRGTTGGRHRGDPSGEDDPFGVRDDLARLENSD